MRDERLETPFWMLRLTYGLVPIVAGLDKFTHFLVDWTQYLSPYAERILPVTGQQFMYAVGVIEIVAGLLVLSRFTRFGAYLVSAWLAAIAINLVTTGQYYDIAVRDLVMAVGAFALAKLAEARAEAGSRVPVRRYPGQPGQEDELGRTVPVPT
jgi:uncharacterized membrane protein YphA (DoxX/SURF4 family)